jgi:polyisoprenoid-binding protein YceI
MTRLLARLLALGLALAAQGAAQAQPARYEIDPEHLSVGFLVQHLGYARVIGLFQKGSGTFTFDETTATLSDVRLVVDAASAYTNHRRRDNHLRSADFLNAGEFPQIVFKGAKAKRTGERTFVVEGQLELLGKSEPVSFDVTWNKSGPYEMPGDKAYVMGASARGSFKRSRFGMNYGVANGWVGDTVELMVEFEARRK